MSPQAKVSWEDTTKWLGRVALFLCSVFMGVGVNQFNEVRADIKQLLLNDAARGEKINALEKEQDLQQSQIDKLRDKI